MPKGVVQIPVSVLLSVETLDELQGWLTAQNPEIMGELHEARREDLAGKFKAVAAPSHAMAYAIEIGSKADAELAMPEPNGTLLRGLLSGLLAGIKGLSRMAAVYEILKVAALPFGVRLS